MDDSELEERQECRSSSPLSSFFAAGGSYDEPITAVLDPIQMGPSDWLTPPRSAL